MSKVPHSKAVEIQSTIKLLIADWKKIERWRKVEGDFSVSQKRRQKARVEIDWLCMDIEKQSHELHCLAVEAGVADRQDWRYGERYFKPDSWHEFRETMREPK